MSAAPSDTTAHAPAGAPSAHAPARVPTQTPICIGARRRSIGPSVLHGLSCQTLVTSDGTINSAAASAGVIINASKAIEIVGSPRPTTPFTHPARRNTAAAINDNTTFGAVMVPK